LSSSGSVPLLATTAPGTYKLTTVVSVSSVSVGSSTLQLTRVPPPPSGGLCNGHPCPVPGI
jgi:hypothetical protein